MPDVYVHCRTLPFGDPAGVPVDDVYVSLHAAGGGNVLADGTTGAGGNAVGTVFFANLAVDTYEIHITPLLPARVSGEALQSIEVVASPDPLVFDVLVDTTGLGVANDANFCRCSGTFRDPYGKPVDSLHIRFSESTLPQLLYYSGSNQTHLVVPKSETIKTDANGFGSVDLIQDQTYLVYMEGFENLAREVKIPKLSNSSLPDVLFPVVRGVEYTDENGVLLDSNNPVLAVSVGQSAALTIETVFRSGLRLDILQSMSLKSSDTDVFTSSLSGNVLTISGVSAGAETLKVTRSIPEEGLGVSPHPEIPVSGALSVTINP